MLSGGHARLKIGTIGNMLQVSEPYGSVHGCIGKPIGEYVAAVITR